MEIMVQACDRARMSEVIGMRDRGLTVANIANRVGISYATLRRYIRLYDRHGLTVFMPED